MSTAVIKLDDVWKAYGSVPALCGLALEVPAQSVYGFLGPNGAGKTTTIRLILGMQKADRGGVALFGHPIDGAREGLLKRVGAIVESPCSYPHLTARENLEVHRRILGLPKTAIAHVLSMVALEPVADRQVKGYSLGMKQRLGLAFALLSEPDLLLLDEPTNGLDPAGIHEIRSLIRSLPAKHGTTVFLSSHLLPEVEQVATHVGILSLGRLKYQGTREQLASAACPAAVLVVDHPERALSILRSKELKAMSEGHRITVELEPSVDVGQINAVLVSGGVTVSHLSRRNASLEEIFLELTGSERPAR